jgi:tetratricopeptide (TPR) repeat protein
MDFNRFTEKSTDGKLYEDASFRKSVCLYGLENYPLAAEKLEEFLREFPVDNLTPEAHTLLADCYGAIGDLEKALDHYKQVEDCAVKQSQLNLMGAFPSSEVYKRPTSNCTTDGTIPPPRDRPCFPHRRSSDRPWSYRPAASRTRTDCFGS